jgi:hypothetical protein
MLGSLLELTFLQLYMCLYRYLTKALIIGYRIIFGDCGLWYRQCVGSCPRLHQRMSNFAWMRTSLDQENGEISTFMLTIQANSLIKSLHTHTKLSTAFSSGLSSRCLFTLLYKLWPIEYDHDVHPNCCQLPDTFDDVYNLQWNLQMVQVH